MSIEKRNDRNWGQCPQLDLTTVDEIFQPEHQKLWQISPSDDPLRRCHLTDKFEIYHRVGPHQLVSEQESRAYQKSIFDDIDKAVLKELLLLASSYVPLTESELRRTILWAGGLDDTKIAPCFYSVPHSPSPNTTGL